MYFCKSEDLYIYPGEEKTLVFQIVRADGIPKNLVDCVVSIRIQRYIQDSSPVVDWAECTITDVTDGMCTLDVETADTSLWDEGDYKLQLKVVSSVETHYVYPVGFFAGRKLEDVPS